MVGARPAQLPVPSHLCSVLSPLSSPTAALFCQAPILLVGSTAWTPKNLLLPICAFSSCSVAFQPMGRQSKGIFGEKRPNILPQDAGSLCRATASRTGLPEKCRGDGAGQGMSLILTSRLQPLCSGVWLIPKFPSCPACPGGGSAAPGSSEPRRQEAPGEKLWLPSLAWASVSAGWAGHGHLFNLRQARCAAASPKQSSAG